MMSRNIVECFDTLQFARYLPDNSVHCIVTSPPYFSLRNYNVDGQMGLESTPQEYVSRMVEVFREYRRVLREDGTLWLNIGDSYANDSKWGGQSGEKNYTSTAGGYEGQRKKRHTGFKPKDLMMIPARLAIALCDDGWYLRSDIIWSKKNCMPESVTDRPTNSHEHIFLLAKSPSYFFDQEAIREPQTGNTHSRGNGSSPKEIPQHDGLIKSNHSFNSSMTSYTDVPGGRNCRSVWTIATEPTPFAHFATFPQKLVERCILAGCPHKTCVTCGAPWERVIDRDQYPDGEGNFGKNGSKWKAEDKQSSGYRLRKNVEVMRQVSGNHDNPFPPKTTTGWQPTCDCNGETIPGIVLDPFVGSGTTCLVARRLGRDYLGCDLNPDYVKMANSRLDVPYTLPMMEVLQA